ncbi:MAG: S8 family serine peptidase [Bdellovibrionales bacterium]
MVAKKTLAKEVRKDLQEKFHVTIRSVLEDTNSKFLQRSYVLVTTKSTDINLIADELLKNKSIEALYSDPLASMHSIVISKRKSGEGFLDKQWYLEYSDQKISYNLEDDRPVVVQGLKDASIDYQFIKRFQNGKTPRVAIVDGGVDISHPQLSRSIDKDKRPCILTEEDERKYNESLSEGKRPRPLCKLWNFATGVFKNKKNISYKIEHGPHVTGIIAAKFSKDGTRGIADNTKILPLKVYQSGQEVKKEEGLALNDKLKGQAYSSQTLSAISHALRNGYRVINLSLGWTKIASNPVLEEAFQFLIKDRGAILIAASGNDGNPLYNYPCAYEGVICVGSHGIDAKISDFTTYGAQVDFLAPGDTILSTYSSLAETKSSFKERSGYEYLTGTSQATPFIASYASLLVAENPDITLEQIYAKFLLASSTDSNKTLSGKISFKKAALTKLEPISIPVFKGNGFSTVTDKRFQLQVPIKHLVGRSTYNLSISSLPNGIQEVGSSCAKENEIRDVCTYTFEIENLDMDSLVEIGFSFKSGDSIKRNFTHYLSLNRQISTNKLQRGILGFFKRFNSNDCATYCPEKTPIKSVKPITAGVDSSAYYQFVKPQNSNAGSLRVLRKRGATLERFEIPLKCSKLAQFDSFKIRTSGNIFYRLLCENKVVDGKIKNVKMLLLDHDFKAIDGKNREWVLGLDEAFPNKFTKDSVRVLAKNIDGIEWPVFVLWAKLGNKSGSIDATVQERLSTPSVQKTKNFKKRVSGRSVNPKAIEAANRSPSQVFSKATNEKLEYGVFLLEPRKVSNDLKLVTKKITDKAWTKQFRLQFKRQFRKHGLLHLIPQSTQDLNSNQFWLGLGAGELRFNNYFVQKLILTNEGLIYSPFQKVNTKGLDILGNSLVPVLNRDSKVQSKLGFARISTRGARLSMLDLDSLEFKTQLISNSKNFIGMAGAAWSESMGFSSLTFSAQRIQKDFRFGISETNLESEIYLTSILPGELIKSNLRPVVFSGGSLGAFVDESLLNTPNIYFISEENGKLVRSLKNRFSVPENCTVLAPIDYVAGEKIEIVMDCLVGEAGRELIFFSLD